MADNPKHPSANFFPGFARWCDQQLGRPGAFGVALAVVVLWACCGPLLNWGDTLAAGDKYDLFGRDIADGFRDPEHAATHTEAIQLKLDELIRVNKGTRNELISLEAKPDAEVESVRSNFHEIGA